MCFRFLSTLSLRRATALTLCNRKAQKISIHALLAESDYLHCMLHARGLYFYPRSPCGERHKMNIDAASYNVISIHALLAESDPFVIKNRTAFSVFLSTLSLRRATGNVHRTMEIASNFYPRSPCGERRGKCAVSSAMSNDFYPRSPCGERRAYTLQS